MATSSNSAQSAASSSEIEMRDLLIDDEESKEAEINDISLDEIDTLTDDTLYSFESSAKRPTSFCSGKRAIWLIGGMFVVFVLLIIAGGETLRYVRRPHSQSTDDIGMLLLLFCAPDEPSSHCLLVDLSRETTTTR